MLGAKLSIKRLPMACGFIEQRLDGSLPAGRLYALDVLRMFAAMAVWLYHVAYLDPRFHAAPWQLVNPALERLASYGYLGVNIFFVVSGYVISASAEGRNRYDFLRARFVRLYPAFLICLMVTLFVAWVSGRDVPVSQLVANITMVPRIFGQEALDGVYWSLMFEILFYSAVFIILLGPKFKSRLGPFCVVWLALSVANMLTPLPLRVLLVLEWAPYFCVGCFAWLRSHAPELVWVKWMWVFSVAVAGILAATQTKFDSWIAGLLMVSFAITFRRLIVVQVAPRYRALCILVGALSYPVYLLHNVFGGWVARYSESLVFTIVIVLAISYFVTLFESAVRPFLTRRKGTFQSASKN